MVLYATKSNMKIGIMGGTFNPPHLAHLSCAREAEATCHLDRIVFIPANDPPHKLLDNSIPFDMRCEMTRLAISGFPRFELSTIEGERQGKSYSIDTLVLLAQRFQTAELYFIIGSDSFLELGTWHRYAEIVRTCHLVVLERPGKETESPLQLLPVAIRGEFRYSSESRRLLHSSGKEIIFITGTPRAVSSTEIRSMVRTGQAVSHLVPPAVEEYILTQRIYTE